VGYRPVRTRNTYKREREPGEHENRVRTRTRRESITHVFEIADDDKPEAGRR
jgi:hypothetical protein